MSGASVYSPTSINSASSGTSPLLSMHHLLPPSGGSGGRPNGGVRFLSGAASSTSASDSDARSFHSSSDASSASNSPNLHYGRLETKSGASPGALARSMHAAGGGMHLLPSHLATYSPSGASPGVGVRRLAEQFLNSLTDDSPAVRPRRIGLGKHTTLVTPSVHVPTQAAELDKFAANHTGKTPPLASRPPLSKAKEQAASETTSGDGATNAASGLPPRRKESSGLRKSTVITVPVDSAPSLLHPNTPSVAHAEDDFEQLHADILAFSNACAEDTQNQKRLREELVQRTQWSIRCVWPTAQVDLVGSVAAGVCLPRSDLDFVIYFKESHEPPPSYSYATTPQNGQGQGTVTNYTYTTTTAPPIVEPAVDENGVPITPPPKSPVAVQHFAHAATMIKLIGGRKKSKLLFRSTKIQVFKDINLIRLRDGCSGISMDLWFPVDPTMLTRSQQHTMLIQKMQADFPNSFYPLAIVLKSFMSSNLLNSGYSGLGSYGVLLMLIRYLQYERFNASKEKRSEESNLGRLLVGFFRLYATFDYIHHAIDVVNLGPDGGFIAKPPVIIVKRVKRPTTSTGTAAGAKKAHRRSKKSGEASEEEDEEEGDEADVSEGGEEEPEEERESASLKKKRSNAADRFTLVILDPMDPQNQIICHHKALRNMIGAFIRAIMILDPENEAPELLLPAVPTTDTPAVPGAGALTATGPGVPPNSQPPSAPSTPPLVPQPISSLPAFPGLTATANNTNATRFHRLIEVNTARLGPQTKPCPSAQCMNPDGSSKTLCPIQNKVCFTCGHQFVKGVYGGATAATTTAPTQGGKNAKAMPNSPANLGNTAPMNHQPPRHGHSASMGQHRSPPMQGQHQRHYLNPRAPQQMQQQHPSIMQQQQQQQLYNAQTMMAAQHILAAQLSSQQAAAAAAAAAAANGAPMPTSPLMYYNLQTNQIEPQPLGFVPVMAYPPYTTSDPTMAAMNAFMQQMQISSMASPQVSPFLSPMYGQSVSPAPDLSAYTYVPPLSYDHSPLYATRSLSDPMQPSMASVSPTPPSPPLHLRATSGGPARVNGTGPNGKGTSSRANHTFNQQGALAQQQQPPPQPPSQQAPYYPQQ